MEGSTHPKAKMMRIARFDVSSSPAYPFGLGLLKSSSANSLANLGRVFVLTHRWDYRKIASFQFVLLPNGYLLRKDGHDLQASLHLAIFTCISPFTFDIRKHEAFNDGSMHNYINFLIPIPPLIDLRDEPVMLIIKAPVSQQTIMRFTTWARFNHVSMNSSEAGEVRYKTSHTRRAGTPTTPKCQYDSRGK